MKLGSLVRGCGPGLLLILSACASPREHYYLLDLPGPDNQAWHEKSSTVIVGPVVIPSEVDRPQIVVRKGSHELEFGEQSRWAVPLKEALPQLLAVQLSRGARTNRFVPIASAVSSTAAAQLAIDVTRFEVSYEGGAIVALRWIYRPASTGVPVADGNAEAHSPVEIRRVDGLVDALRRAMAQAVETMALQLSPNL